MANLQDNYVIAAVMAEEEHIKAAIAWMQGYVAGREYMRRRRAQ